MRARKNPNEIFWDIKKEIPLFDKKEIVEYTKWAIPILYDAIKNDEIENFSLKDYEEMVSYLYKDKRTFANYDDVLQYLESLKK